MISNPLSFFFAWFLFLPVVSSASPGLFAPLLALGFIASAAIFIPSSLPVLILAAALSGLTVLGLFNSRRIKIAGAFLVVCMVYFKIVSPGGATVAPLGSPLGFLFSLPVGFSFFFFSIIGFWVDRQWIPERSLSGISKLFCATFFLPALLAGPFLSASHLLRQFEKSRVTRLDTTLGLTIFTWGCFKKVLADAFSMGLFARMIPLADESAPAGIARIITLSLRLYLDFSGYSDIACGLSQMLGLRLPLNFSRPFEAKTYVEFWSRWNHSLSSWFRRYVFTPMWATYPRWRRVPPNLFLFVVLAITCGALAAWHGFSLIFLFWFFLVMAGLWIRVRSILISRLVTLILVVLSTSLVPAGSLDDWISLLRQAAFGAPGTLQAWSIVIFTISLLYMVQSVDLARLRSLVVYPSMLLPAGLACWVLIFFLSFGRTLPLFYAAF